MAFWGGLLPCVLRDLVYPFDMLLGIILCSNLVQLRKELCRPVRIIWLGPVFQGGWPCHSLFFVFTATYGTAPLIMYIDMSWLISLYFPWQIRDPSANFFKMNQGAHWPNHPADAIFRKNFGSPLNPLDTSERTRVSRSCWEILTISPLMNLLLKHLHYLFAHVMHSNLTFMNIITMIIQYSTHTHTQSQYRLYPPSFQHLLRFRCSQCYKQVSHKISATVTTMAFFLAVIVPRGWKGRSFSPIDGAVSLPLKWRTMLLSIVAEALTLPGDLKMRWATTVITVVTVESVKGR